MLSYSHIKYKLHSPFFITSNLRKCYSLSLRSSPMCLHSVRHGKKLQTLSPLCPVAFTARHSRHYPCNIKIKAKSKLMQCSIRSHKTVALSKIKLKSLHVYTQCKNRGNKLRHNIRKVVGHLYYLKCIRYFRFSLPSFNLTGSILKNVVLLKQIQNGEKTIWSTIIM